MIQGDVEAIAGVITAAAAVATAAIAFFGLSTWRAELVGRRKAEIAEEGLADFYRMADVFDWVRNPGGHEGAIERAGRDDEDADLAARLDAYAVPVSRLQAHAEFIGAMHAKRYRFRAMFGPDALSPFEDLRELRVSNSHCVYPSERGRAPTSR